MAQLPHSGFIWHELMTTDTDGAQSFYHEVAGLTTSPGPYLMLLDGDQPIGGLVGPGPDGPIWPSGGPQPHWIPYIAVDDTDAAARKAEELGGKVLVPPTDIPEFGRVAVLRDPQGAGFGVFRPSAR